MVSFTLTKYLYKRFLNVISDEEIPTIVVFFLKYKISEAMKDTMNKLEKPLEINNLVKNRRNRIEKKQFKTMNIVVQ